jgi:hypothetical protein
MEWTVAIGVDTHEEMHVAVALDALGAQLVSKEISTTPAGYRRLLAWAQELGVPAFAASRELGGAQRNGLMALRQARLVFKRVVGRRLGAPCGRRLVGVRRRWFAWLELAGRVWRGWLTGGDPPLWQYFARGQADHVSTEPKRTWADGASWRRNRSEQDLSGLRRHGQGSEGHRPGADGAPALGRIRLLGQGKLPKTGTPSAPLGVSAAAETQARDGADGAKARPTQPVSRPGR